MLSGLRWGLLDGWYSSFHALRLGMREDGNSLRIRTGKHLGEEEFLYHWGILLDVAPVVIERAVFARLQQVGVAHHLVV